MNKRELIERMEGLKNLFGTKSEYVEIDTVIELISELDEPETGHADEAPRYVKNILARLRELPVHDREVWLKAIMGEFEQDFSHAKWREGYEQRKFEGAWVGNQLKDADKIRQGLNRVKIPQFVADWIEEARKTCKDVIDLFEFDFTNDEVGKWFMQERPFDLVARAWLDGYEVEKAKRYLVKMKGIKDPNSYLKYNRNMGHWYFGSLHIYVNDVDTKIYHTRKELEEANFGWMFDCEGVEIEEVEK